MRIKKIGGLKSRLNKWALTPITPAVATFLGLRGVRRVVEAI
jgi:hypothetical protein